MKPAWDQLMEEFKDSKTALVADVDCTVEEALCERMKVEGYPTIKYGDPNDLQDYDGGRELEELKTFASTNLGPTCSLKNLDLCDEAQKKAITEVQDLSNEKLLEILNGRLEAKNKVQKEFEEAVQKLEEEYQKLEEEKAAKLEEFGKTSPAMSTLKMVAADRGLEIPQEESEEDETMEGEDEPEGEEEMGGSESHEAADDL